MNETGNEKKASEKMTDDVDPHALLVLMAKLDQADRKLVIDFAKQLQKVDSE
jgi:hypothetical protein